MSDTASQSMLERVLNNIKSVATQDSMQGLFDRVSNAPSGRLMVVFGVSLFAGMLLRRCARFLFFFCLFSLLIMLFLEHVQIVTVDWDSLWVMLGFEPGLFALESTGELLWGWAHRHSIMLGTGLIGFFIGHKLG